jgi:hypothetical protein
MPRLIATLLCAAFGTLAFVGSAPAQAQTKPAAKLTWGYANPSAYYWDAYAAMIRRTGSRRSPSS